MDRLAALSGSELLQAALLSEKDYRICAVSAFGAESAVLLDMIARIDRSLPILFVDTGRHFPETLAYRDQLVERLRLRDVRSVGPAKVGIEGDPGGTRYADDPDGCCDQRKVIPLDDALQGFDVWITGRKRFQGGMRSDLKPVEADGPDRWKLNPLADWDPARIETYFTAFRLPRHPLAVRGYKSIGCAPCTRPPNGDGSSRDGRWAGSEKTECGIHRYRNPRAA